MAQLEQNKQLVREFWDEVYVRRNYDAIARFFAADGVYEDVPTPGNAAHGPVAVATRLRIGHEPVQSFRHDIHRMVAEGDTVITEHTETWCFHTGEEVALPFVTVQELRDGKIALWRDYWDLGTLMNGAPQWWLDHIMQFSPEDFDPPA